MENYYEQLVQDHRFKEGLISCINCGTCTAICPAAEFYNYDPRTIANIVQSKDNEAIEALLKGEEIWYCGQCMSCVTRCPRKNAPGLIILALRDLSLKRGLFIESEKGRQQFAVNRVMSSNILNYGYCIYPRTFKHSMHPESGPVHEWVERNLDDVYKRAGGNLDGDGPGILRKIPAESLNELKKIFDITGATEMLEIVEKHSLKKAEELGMTPEEYFEYVFTTQEKEHSR